MTKLDDKGRCCGRKPLFYKGGNWRSPPGAPMYYCCECSREFGPDGNLPRRVSSKATSGQLASFSGD